MKRSESGFLRSLRIRTLGFLAALVLRVLHATLRWHRPGKVSEPNFLNDGVPKIFVFWHGRQLMMPWGYHGVPGDRPKKALHMLISQHADGRIIASAVERLGIRTVAGSSSRGGKEAAQDLIARLQEGDHVAITPDGPRGPACQCKPGAIKIAKITGAPIYPAAYGTRRRWRFGSWDGMILPKPFSPGVFYVGEPVYVPADASEERLEELRKLLDQRLNEATAYVDNFDYDAGTV